MTESSPQPAYANVVEVTTGPYDLVLDFGFRPPESAKKQSTDFEVVSRVAMSLSHAKTMLPLLARAIADYESRIGTIPAPGFDEMSKE